MVHYLHKLLTLVSFTLIIQNTLSLETKTYIEDCIIDKGGIFKYIQIEIKNLREPSDTRIILRGSELCNSHSDIFSSFISENNLSNVKSYTYSPIGGGRINISGNVIYVYGYSSLYGRANHQLTLDIIKSKCSFAMNYELKWSNDGY